MPVHAPPAVWDLIEVTPRRWQREALPPTLQAILRRLRVVVRACTGAGKSMLILAIVAWALEALVADPTAAIVITVPTRQLVKQLSETLSAALGADVVGRVATGVCEADRRVVVVCAPSLRKYLEHRGDRRTALWIADEAHGTVAPHIAEHVEVLAPSSVVGLTATPFRADEREALDLFRDGEIFAYSYADALRDGVCVRAKVVTWDGQGRDEGDMDGIMLDLIRAHAKGPGVVNARSISDAEDYAAYLVEHGIRALPLHSQLTGEEVSRRLELLRTGKIRALVAVSMLAEGVDLPWLRWLGLRRNTSSPVRLVQEFGRVLRACEGKDFAVVLDPGDIVHRIGLDHPARLEAALDGVIPAAEPLGQGGQMPDRESAPHRAVAVTALGRWVRTTLRVLRAEGLARPPQVAAAVWRAEAPSAKQLQTVARMRWAVERFPAAHRSALAVACRDATLARLTRGEVADVLDVLFACSRARRGIVLPAGVTLPTAAEIMASFAVPAPASNRAGRRP